jgi:site-specific recombinase XerD
MAKRRIPVVLTDQELAVLLGAVRTTSPTGLRNKAMLKIMAYGGLRVSEVTALRTTDVRREGGRVLLDVRAGKGDKDRTVPLPDHVAETLDAWMVARRALGIGPGRVFCTIRKGRSVHPVATTNGFAAGRVTESELTPGDPLSARYVQALVARLARRAGLEKRVTPHVLRHTAATRTLRAHGDVRRVQDLLGHSNVATTQIYTHVDAAEVAEAVDLVPDVEAYDRAEPAPAAGAEAAQVAAQVLAALPAELRAALMKLAGEGADSAGVVAGNATR